MRKKQREPRRGHGAQEVHNRLLRCLKEFPTPPVVEQVMKLIDRLDATDMIAVSANGHSLIADCVHLPSANLPPEQAGPISAGFIKHLLTRARGMRGVTGFFLTHGDDVGGFLPMHDVLRSGNREVVDLYFEEWSCHLHPYHSIREAVLHERRAAFADQLKGLTYNDDSSLQYALSAGNTMSLITYLDALMEMVGRGYITHARLGALLLRGNEPGYSPLTEAITAGNPTNLGMYLDRLQHAVEEGWVTVKQYNRLLRKRNKFGFSPLHHTMTKGTAETLRVMVQRMEHAVAEGWMTAKEWEEQLLGTNGEGFTPLLQAAKSTDDGIAEIYLEALERALYTERITKAAFIETLTKPNNYGYRPLDQILKFGNTNDASLYMQLLRLVSGPGGWMTNKEYAQQLSYCAPNGTSGSETILTSPLLAVLESKDTDKMAIYCDEVWRSVNAKWMTHEEFVKLLFERNSTYSPLEQALHSGNTANLRKYLEAVKHAVTKGWMKPRKYNHLLTRVGGTGLFSPLHHALKGGNTGNAIMYCEAMLCAYIEGRMTGEERKQLLTQPNKYGYTPLHQAANSGNWELYDYFASFLTTCLDSNTMREQLKGPEGCRRTKCTKDNATSDAGIINDDLERRLELSMILPIEGKINNNLKRRLEERGLEERKRGRGAGIFDYPDGERRLSVSDSERTRHTPA